MRNPIVGTWRLTAWRRLTNGADPAYPFGEDATGLLIYADDGRMAVQMTAAHRPKLAIDDPLGGPVEARATAYSTCLAYFGSYAFDADAVTHRIKASLFPDWSGEAQVRPYTLDGDTLVLRTPPKTEAGRTIVNEMAWVRASAGRDG